MRQVLHKRAATTHEVRAAIQRWSASIKKLVLVSVLILHAFVYSLGFAGEEQLPGEDGFWRSFFGYTLVGYGIALIISLYVLWTFGRTEGSALPQIAMMTTVLGFPAALGAAIARLVV